MKYLAGLMLLMLVHVASAAPVECQLNGSSWFDVQTHGFNAYVDVAASTSLQKVLLNYYVMNCRQTLPAAFGPSLQVTTQADAVRFHPQYSHLQGGLVMGTNSYYPTPVRAGLLLGTHTTGPYTSVVGGPYLNITTTPGKYIEIKSGSLIATINLAMRLSNPVTGTQNFTTFVNVYAKNSLNLSPSTCTINNNNPINIDFGSIDPLAISGDIPEGTPYRRTVVLDYSCPDAGINSPIDIKFLGSPSTFNPRALATSNPDLATAMIHFSSLVPPGGSFSTNITNSSGRNTMLFTLFRRTGSLPKAGPFDASATLVLSPP